MSEPTDVPPDDCDFVAVVVIEKGKERKSRAKIAYPCFVAASAGSSEFFVKSAGDWCIALFNDAASCDEFGRGLGNPLQKIQVNSRDILVHALQNAKTILVDGKFPLRHILVSAEHGSKPAKTTIDEVLTVITRPR